MHYARDGLKLRNINSCQIAFSLMLDQRYLVIQSAQSKIIMLLLCKHRLLNNVHKALQQPIILVRRAKVIWRKATSLGRYLISYSPGGSTRREVGCAKVHLGFQFLEIDGPMESAMVPFKRVIGLVVQALHCGHCDISNHSAAICNRMSATLTVKSTGVGHFRVKFGEERVDR